MKCLVELLRPGCSDKGHAVSQHHMGASCHEALLAQVVLHQIKRLYVPRVHSWTHVSTLLHTRPPAFRPTEPGCMSGAWLVPEAVQQAVTSLDGDAIFGPHHVPHDYPGSALHLLSKVCLSRQSQSCDTASRASQGRACLVPQVAKEAVISLRGAKQGAEQGSQYMIYTSISGL